MAASAGLLARSHGYSSGAWTNHNAYHADAGGNITYLVNTGQALAASYRYDLFGNLIASSGTHAFANNYRFSSKYLQSCYNVSLYYYGYRFYHPHLQRWLNQDPIGEEGGINLYCFVKNQPTLVIDSFGLKFVYYGPHKDDYKKAIDCWKTFPADSPLRQLVDDLEKSPRDIRIRDLKSGKITRPATKPDDFDKGEGHDTTTWIDPKSYTYDGRTWAFEEALAHELLHAQDDQNPNKIGRGHGDPDFIDEERKLTDEAKKKCDK